VIALRLYNENKFTIDKIEVITKLNEKTILEAIDRKNKKYKNDINGSYNIDRNCNNIDIINLKMDLKRCYEEIKELKENVKNIMELVSCNKRDDIEDLKKQIQYMLDINNIKNDIIELKNALNKI
jgi:DNA-directed RNA polymerase specialized sigma subunit